jgi:hypothetical protein
MVQKPTLDWADAIQKSLKRHERPGDDDFLTVSVEKVLKDIHEESPLLEASCRALLLLDLHCVRERLVHALSVCESDAEKALCIGLIVVARQRIENSSSQVGETLYNLNNRNGEMLLIEHAPILAGRRVAFRLTLQIPQKLRQKNAGEAGKVSAKQRPRVIQKHAIVECDSGFDDPASSGISSDHFFFFSSLDIAKDPLECAITAIRSLEQSADHDIL